VTFTDPVTRNGQDVTLTVGSKTVRLAPGESYAYQTKKDETLKVKAKPQLSKAGMRSAEMTIRNTRLLEDFRWWINSHAGSSPMHLSPFPMAGDLLRGANRKSPRSPGRPR
jgi:hypothetical protein